MVGITVVYVIATIFICWANIKSANASRAQVEESKRQFEETQQLETMPFLYLERIKNTGADFELSLPIVKNSSNVCHYSSLLRLSNVGNGTATNIVYKWCCSEKDVELIDYFPLNAVTVNMSRNFEFFYMESHESDGSLPSKGVLYFYFDDLLGRSYVQKIILQFGEEVGGDILIECNPDIPHLENDT